MVDLLEQFGHLVLGAETGSARFAAGAYGFWFAHVRALLAEAGTPGADRLPDVLLAPLAPELYRRQRRDRGLSAEQVADQLEWLAHRLLADPAG